MPRADGLATDRFGRFYWGAVNGDWTDVQYAAQPGADMLGEFYDRADPAGALQVDNTWDAAASVGSPKHRLERWVATHRDCAGAVCSNRRPHPLPRPPESTIAIYRRQSKNIVKHREESWDTDSGATSGVAPDMGRGKDRVWSGMGRGAGAGRTAVGAGAPGPAGAAAVAGRPVRAGAAGAAARAAGQAR